MSSVSYPPLKSRWPHGLNVLLLSVLFVLSAVTSLRAQFLVTNSLKEISSGGYYTFATNGIFTATNTVVISNNVIIDGGASSIILSGGNSNRIFVVNKGATLTLINLELAAGKNAAGAAIYNSGTVGASNITFYANNATNAPGANGVAGGAGHIDGTDGAPGAYGQGGAIFNNHGYLTLTNCVFTNNFAIGGNGGSGGAGYSGNSGNGGTGGAGGYGQGGAIFNTGTNIVFGCYFVGNVAAGGIGGAGGASGGGSVGSGGVGGNGAGAGIYNLGGIMHVTNSTFYANQSFGGPTAPQGLTANGTSAYGQNGGAAAGAGIHNNTGTLTMVNCTFFTNTCLGGKGGDTIGDPTASAGTGGVAAGGAIGNAGTMLAINCTFATNSVFGGAIGVSPFAGKSGSLGQALGGNLYRSAGASTIRNCLLQHGAGADSYGGVTDGGYNISSDTSCAFTAAKFSLSNTNAHMAASLSDYPGAPPVLEFIPQTHPQNCAQDRIPPIPANNPTNCPTFDERGFPRFTGTNQLADVGAFEFSPTPPRILTQPKDQYAIKGGSATFTVSATGETPLYYQWQFLATNGTLTTVLAGTNDYSLTITNVQTSSFGTYSVVITNDLGSITSSNAVLSAEVAPSITSQSSDVTVPFGGTAVFSVGASGAPLSYQWFFGNTPLTDASNHFGTATASLTINNATRADQGAYHVTITNALGSVNSSSLNLTVNDPGIVTQPQDVTVAYNARAVFTVLAASSTNIAYQWRQGPNVISATNKIPNAIFASFTNNAATTNNFYSVVVSNALGTATSTAAALTVLNPAITVPPTNQIVDPGATATFTVTAAGVAPLSYQWNSNGVPMISQTNQTLSIPNVTTSDAASYSVKVSNGSGSQTSAAALLIVRGGSTISGQITFGTNGVAGVTINNGSTNVTSGSGGFYNFSQVPAGTYTIAPAQIGSGVTPFSITIAVDGINPATNINFAFQSPLLQITATPSNNIVPLEVLSAPSISSTLQSTSDLTNWSNALVVTPDTNGVSNVTVTNSSATNAFFLRLITP